MLDTAGFPVATAAANESLPTMAIGTGSTTLVLFARIGGGGASDLATARVASGVGLGAPVTVAAASANIARHAVTYDATRFLAVYPFRRTSNTSDIRATWLDATGKPQGSEITIARQAIEELPAAAFAGGSHVVVFASTRGAAYPGRDVYLARIDAATQRILDDDLVVANGSASQTIPGIAAGGGAFLVVWQGSSEIRGALVSFQ